MHAIITTIAATLLLAGALCVVDAQVVPPVVGLKKLERKLPRIQRIEPTLTRWSRAKSLALSPDGAKLATCGANGMVRIWSVGEVAFGGSPERLYVAAHDFHGRGKAGGIGVYYARSYQMIGARLHPETAIRAMVLGPRGKRVICTCTDETPIQIWTLARPRPLGR